MLSLIPLLTFAACAMYFLAMVRVVTAMCEAPIGYEDEEGFHYGIKAEDSESW